MRFVDSSFEIINQSPKLIGVYEQIERAARTSYKSEDRITEGSAQRMVDMLVKNKHYACLEHGTIYLKIPNDNIGNAIIIDNYRYNKYSVCKEPIINYLNDYINAPFAYITTNARVLVENGWLDDLQYLCEPTEYHEKRITVKFITSIGVVREMIRHRTFSFMNESTRYCNYSKDKFDNQLTFIIPEWIYNVQCELADKIDWPLNDKKDYLMNYTGEQLVNILCVEDRTVNNWYTTLLKIEDSYLFTTSTDESFTLKAEEARGILPLDLKSELVMTGFISDWIHFFRLRSHIAATGKPHPDLQKLADGLMQEFIDKGFCTYENITKNKESI